MEANGHEHPSPAKRGNRAERSRKLSSSEARRGGRSPPQGLGAAQRPRHEVTSVAGTASTRRRRWSRRTRRRRAGRWTPSPRSVSE